MENVRKNVGQRIRQLRKELGWSQEKLSQRARLHPTYIGGIERGERNVSLLNLAKLSEAFHITMAELLQFPAEKKEDRVLTQLITEGDELGLAFYSAFCMKCESLKRFRELKTLHAPPEDPIEER